LLASLLSPVGYGCIFGEPGLCFPSGRQKEDFRFFVFKKLTSQAEARSTGGRIVLSRVSIIFECGTEKAERGHVGFVAAAILAGFYSATRQK
jgi:hypothetical protein